MSGDDTARRALDLFDELVELPPAEREARLAAMAGPEPALHARVRALLAADAADGGLLALDPAQLIEALGENEGEGAPEDEADPLLGQRIGPWRIDGILGRGGMGAVYLGERVDGEFSQQAAIKRIRLGLDRAELRRRFLRERQILARLQHPNIASLLDGGVDAAGAPYFAMEKVDGLPIDRWCDQQRLDLRGRVRLFLQVCAAVQHAHRALAVHRDLKPGNILVTPAGQAKLLDFGIAKLLEAADEENETQTRDRALTPEYAAPEQLRGEPVTTAVDVYALGLVLYGLLAGCHAFAETPGGARATWRASPDREPESIVRAAARTDPAAAQARRLRPGELAAALRGDLASIVHTCLAAEPGQRYATVEALALDLGAWLDGRPIQARAGQRGYRLRKFLMRHRWGVATAAAAVLAVGAALAIALVQAREARAQAAHAAHTSEFVVSLFERANPMKNEQGSKLTAAELLQDAAARVDAELSDAPDTQAQLRVSIGFSLRELGDPRAGLPLLERGIHQLRALPADAEPLAKALQKLAMAREDLGQLDGAEAALAEAIALLEAAPGDHRLASVQLRTSLAKLLNLRGRPREALAQYEAIQRERSALIGADHPDTAVDWNNLGNTYLLVDRCDDAERAFQRARALLEAGVGAGHPRTAWVLVGLAWARECAGRYAEAAADLDAAERILQEKLTPRHLLAISLHSGRANLAFRQGRVAEAVARFDAALALARELENPGAPRIQGKRAVYLLALGRYEEAARDLDEVLALLERDGRIGADPYLQRLRSARGVARFHTGRRAEGEAEVRAVLAALDAAGYAASDDYADSAADLAGLLAARGEAAESAAWAERSRLAWINTFGPGHPLSRATAATAPAASR